MDQSIPAVVEGPLSRNSLSTPINTSPPRFTKFSRYSLLVGLKSIGAEITCLYLLKSFKNLHLFGYLSYNAWYYLDMETLEYKMAGLPDLQNY